MRVDKQNNKSFPPDKGKEINLSIAPYKRKYIKRPFRSTGGAKTSRPPNWNERFLRVFSEWRETRGEGIRIAILDTGIDPEHPSLKDNVKASRNFTGSISKIDEEGHGTMVAGIIAASGESGTITGVAPNSELYIGKVLMDLNGGKKEDLIDGIEWAMGKTVGGGERIDKAHIIHLSLTTEEMDQDLHDAIKEAVSKGMFVICAAGNKGAAGVEFPARYEESIAVGAVNRAGTKLKLSARGQELDFVALGDMVKSTFPRYFEGSTGFSVNSGTSLAAPFVTGVSALALAKHRSAGGNTQITNPKELIEHLRRIVIDLPPTGFDPNTGFGLIKPESIKDEEL
jgi:subtilisin family serine protease